MFGGPGGRCVAYEPAKSLFALHWKCRLPSPPRTSGICRIGGPTNTADPLSAPWVLAMPSFDRITSDPRIMNGQPCVRGMRLTVRRVLEAVATYPDRAELRREYPELEEEDIRQALAFAAANLDDRVFELRSAS